MTLQKAVTYVRGLQKAYKTIVMGLQNEVIVGDYKSIVMTLPRRSLM